MNGSVGDSTSNNFRNDLELLDAHLILGDSSAFDLSSLFMHHIREQVGGSDIRGSSSGSLLVPSPSPSPSPCPLSPFVPTKSGLERTSPLVAELEMPPPNTAIPAFKLQDQGSFFVAEPTTADIIIFPMFTAAAGSVWRIKVLGVTGADLAERNFQNLLSRATSPSFAGACVCVGDYIALCQLPPVLIVAQPFCLIISVTISDVSKQVCSLYFFPLHNEFFGPITLDCSGFDVCCLANRFDALTYLTRFALCLNFLHTYMKTLFHLYSLNFATKLRSQRFFDTAEQAARSLRFSLLVTFLIPLQTLLVIGQELKSLQLSSLSRCFDIQVMSHVFLALLPNHW